MKFSATAEHYGRLEQQIVPAGTPISENDHGIAAVAMEHSLPLATLDTHFQRVPGLTVLDWQ